MIYDICMYVCIYICIYIIHAHINSNAAHMLEARQSQLDEELSAARRDAAQLAAASTEQMAFSTHSGSFKRGLGLCSRGFVLIKAGSELILVRATCLFL